MTAATTDDRRPAPRGGARLCALAALGLLLLCLTPARAQDARAGGPGQTPPGEETVDSVLTKAGALTLVRSGPEDGLRIELRLNGRKVADVDGTMHAGFKAYFRGLGDGEVVVMWASDGGSGCPAQFRVARIVEEARVSLSEEFGDCSDSPDITLKQLPAEEIQFRFPGYYRLVDAQEPGFRKPPPTTWVYRKGLLRELKPAGKRRG